jgi:hypothetical protein
MKDASMSSREIEMHAETIQFCPLAYLTVRTGLKFYPPMF